MTSRSFFSGLLFCIGLMGSVYALESQPASARPDSSAGLYPSQELLDQLEERLFSPHECQEKHACALLQMVKVSGNSQTLTLDLEIHAAQKSSIALPVISGASLSKIFPDKTLFRKDDKGVVRALVEDGISKMKLNYALTGSTAPSVSFPTPAQLVRSTPDWQINSASSPVESMTVTYASALPSQKKETKAEESVQSFNAPLFFETRKEIWFEPNEIRAQTTLVRLSPTAQPASAEILLIPGELPMDSNTAPTENGKLRIEWPAGSASTSFVSKITQSEALTLTAPQNLSEKQTWMIYINPRLIAKFDGLRPIVAALNDVLVFMPYGGETLKISATTPKSADGNWLAWDKISSVSTLSETKRIETLQFFGRNSVAGKATLKFDEQSKIESLRVNQNAQAQYNFDKGVLIVDLPPGENHLEIQLLVKKEISTLTSAPQIDLGTASANLSWKLILPSDRWILWTGGALMGPSVLLWGALILIALGAGLLPRLIKSPWAPNSLGWIIFTIPLALQSLSLIALPILAALFLYAKEKLQLRDSWVKNWNTYQSLLMIVWLFAAVSLLSGIYGGLLGHPNSMISAGPNGGLSWYHDLAKEHFIGAYVVSAPLWLFRTIMMIWAILVAKSLIGRIPAIWNALADGGFFHNPPPAMEETEAYGMEGTEETNNEANPLTAVDAVDSESPSNSKS